MFFTSSGEVKTARNNPEPIFCRHPQGVCQTTNHAICITRRATGNTICHNNFWQNNAAGRGTTDGRSQAFDYGGGTSGITTREKREITGATGMVMVGVLQTHIPLMAVQVPMTCIH